MRTSLLLVMSFLSCAAAFAGETAPGQGVTVLDTYSFWRCHATYRPMLGGTAAVPRPAPIPKEWVRIVGDDGKPIGKKLPTVPPGQPCSPSPPAGWTDPDFDDHGWWRDPAPFYGRYGGGQPLALALLCLRGKFAVDEPGKVKELRLDVAFRGGIVVYLNGREAYRSHMPEGKVDFETPASDYPAEAFFVEKDVRKLKGEAKKARYELRVRRTDDVAIPVSSLRKGVNVLAIEIHRAALGNCKTSNRRGWGGAFNTCGLLSVKLRSPSGDGITPNRVRPPGLQVWNADLLDLVTVVDYGDPNEKLCPVRIAATRNGEFSSQIVVSDDKPIKGLSAKVSALKSSTGEGELPPSAVRVRYPTLEAKKIANCYLHPRFPWKDDWGHGHWGGGFPNFDTLLADPPAEVRVVDQKGAVKPGHPYVPGAVQTVWVSAAIPPDATPGEYEGTLTVSTQSADPVDVPLRVEVCSWRLPDPRTFSTLMDFIESPETLALYYEVPLWSDRHFDLIGKTFDLLARVGNDAVYVPLIGETHLGNQHSMVAWVKKGDGSFDYDFSIVDRYLDLAEKRMGKPKIVCFQVWDYHVGGDVRFGRSMVGRQRKDGSNPWKPKTLDELVVTFKDASTGELKTGKVPNYMSPESRNVWRSFGAALSGYVKKRNLVGTATLGMAGDILPSRDVVAVWKEIYPESSWMIHGHGGWAGAGIHGVPIHYVSFVAGGITFALVDPEIHRFHGWKTPFLRTLFARGLAMRGVVPAPPLGMLATEWNVEGEQQGLGRLTSDFFRLPGKKKRWWLPQRFASKCSWKNAGLRPEVLSPGKDGAVATARFELIREGVQECEARIFVDRVLTDDAKRAKLGEALAKKCESVLDERTRYHMWAFDYGSAVDYNHGGSLMLGGPADINWYPGSGWQERRKALFSAAGEVAKALAE
jgi:hypothetical protein